MRRPRRACILRMLSKKGVCPMLNQTSEELDMSNTDASTHGEQKPGCPDEPRIYGLFPVQVRGVDSSGMTFHTQTLIDTFCASEFELRLPRRVEAGEQLLVIVDIHEATVALHCKVLRAEPQADRSHRTTVSVTHHRFL